MSHSTGFLPQIEGNGIIAFLKSFKRRKFSVRRKALDALSQLLCGEYRASAAFVDVLESGVWESRLHQLGVPSEGVSSLVAAVTAIFSTDESQFESAKQRMAFALERYVPVQAMADASRQVAENQLKEELRKSLNVMFFEANVRRDCFPPELYFKLQSEPLRAQFFKVFGVEPDIPGLRKTFLLSRPVWEALRDAKAKAWADAQQRWRECIHAAGMPEYLGITKPEFRRWRADGRIPVTFYTEFEKWGRRLETTRHHPHDIAHITPELIALWRETDYAGFRPGPRARALASATQAT
jgi:hypothetical protein